MFDGLNDKLRKLLIIKKKNANLENKLAECKKCIEKLEVYRTKEHEARTQLEAETQLVTEICQIIDVQDKSQAIERLKEIKKSLDSSLIENICRLLNCSVEEVIERLTSLTRIESENQLLSKRLSTLESKLLTVTGVKSIEEAFEKLEIARFESTSEEELQKKVVRLKAKLKDVKLKNEESSNLFHSKLSASTTQIEQLKLEATKTSQIVGQLEKERDQALSEVEKLTRANETLESEVEKATESEASKYEAEIELLKQTHEESEASMKLELKKLNDVIDELKRRFDADSNDDLLAKAWKSDENMNDEQLDAILPHKDTPKLVENAIEDWTRQVLETAETLKSTQSQLKQCQQHEREMGRLLGLDDTNGIRSQSLIAIRIGLSLCTSFGIKMDSDAAAQELSVLEKVFKLSETKTCQELFDVFSEMKTRSREVNEALKASDENVLEKLNQVIKTSEKAMLQLQELRQVEEKFHSVCDLLGLESSASLSEIQEIVKTRTEEEDAKAELLSNILECLNTDVKGYREAIQDLREKERLYEMVKKLSAKDGMSAIDDLRQEKEFVQKLCDEFQVNDYNAMYKHVLSLRDAAAILALVYQKIYETANFRGEADKLKEKHEALVKLIGKKCVNDDVIETVIAGIVERANAFESIREIIKDQRKADAILDCIREMKNREQRLCSVLKCSPEDLPENVGKEHDFVMQVTQGKALKEIMREIEEQNRTLSRLLDMHGMKDRDSLCSALEDEKKRLSELNTVLNDSLGSSDIEEIRTRLRKLVGDGKTLDKLCSIVGVDRGDIVKSVRDLADLASFCAEKFEVAREVDIIKEAVAKSLKHADKLKKQRDKCAKMASELNDGEMTIEEALAQSKSLIKENEKLKAEVENFGQQMAEMKKHQKQLRKILKLPNASFETVIDKVAELVKSQKKSEEDGAKLKEQIMELTGSESGSLSAIDAIKAHRKAVNALCGLTGSSNIEEAIAQIKASQKSAKESAEKVAELERTSQRSKRELTTAKGELERQTAVANQLREQLERHKESALEQQREITSSKQTAKEIYRIIGGATNMESAIARVSEMKRRISELEGELIGAKFVKSISSAFESMSLKDQELLKQIQLLLQKQTNTFVNMISQIKSELQRRNINREQLIAILKRAEVEHARLIEWVGQTPRSTTPLTEHQPQKDLFVKVLPGSSKPPESRCLKTLL